MKREREPACDRQTDREHEQSATVDHGTACDHDEQCSDPASIATRRNAIDSKLPR